jgi:hypothetical protein
VQKECPELARRLVAAGKTVLVETSGSLPIDNLPPEAVRIMDLKCPGSGMCDRNLWSNLDLLDPARDEVKFVLADRADYEWSRAVIRDYTLEKRCAAVLLSALSGALPLEDLAAWMLEDALPARLQLNCTKSSGRPTGAECDSRENAHRQDRLFEAARRVRRNGAPEPRLTGASYRADLVAEGELTPPSAGWWTTPT